MSPNQNRSSVYRPKERYHGVAKLQFGTLGTGGGLDFMGSLALALVLDEIHCIGEQWWRYCERLRNPAKQLVAMKGNYETR